MSSVFSDKTVLITGGTGSFGRAFVRMLLKDESPRSVRIFSRDEYKQLIMREESSDPRLRFLIGDVRSVDRLRLAFRGVDVVIHAAAMKQVPACEYNPFEAVQTNVVGAENVVSAAIDTEVSLVMALSTDKAVNPANLYGATKLCAEKVFTQAQAYAADTATRFACVRYGNVVGSRGSVVPLFLRQAESGTLTLTDTRMTRFWITLEEAVQFVASKAEAALGGEIFIPKLPSMRVVDIADVIAPRADREVIGIRAGEKLHESLLTSEESRHAVDLGDCYVILPHGEPIPSSASRLPDGFEYSSGSNDLWLTAHQFRDKLRSLRLEIDSGP